MTLCVALKGAEGLVLAADSRGTFGDPRGVTAQNDSQKKAHILSPHVALLMSGAAELGSNILLRRPQDDFPDGVTAAMEKIREVARQSYGTWLPHLLPQVPQGIPALPRPDLGFIIAGYDPAQGSEPAVARLYTMVSGLDFAPMLHEYGFALQGIAQYALYILNRLYEPDRTLPELTALAVYAVTETVSQDGKVGGPVRVITIKPVEGCSELPAAEVEMVVEANKLRSENLKMSFYSHEATESPVPAVKEKENA
ncbi:MAG TPA: hypothetical protein VNH38_03310 [Candidatus Dormibacteraeota bacterium]|nr:hypothetical protein [Candidatus Dormibacteraeota bacterium]